MSFTSIQLYAWGAFEVIPLAVAVAVPTVIGLFLFEARALSALAVREVYIILMLWAWFVVTSVVSLNTPLFEHHMKDTVYHLEYVSKILLMVGDDLPTLCNFFAHAGKHGLCAA